MALLVGRWLADRTADRLWAEALGVASTHAAVADLRLILWATGFSAAALWCVGNIYLFYRSIGSVHVPRRLGNIEILEAVPRRYLLAGAVVIGLLLALFLSRDADEWWYARSLLESGTALGATDPVLGRDLADYLFVLPWHRTLHAFATVLTGTLLALIALLYAGVGAVRWHRRRLIVNDLARMHLAVLLAAFAVALFWGYRLEPAEYVAGIHQVALDQILTDVRIPVAGFLSLLALLAAAGSLAWLWLPGVGFAASGWALLAVGSVVGHHALPAFTAVARGGNSLGAPELGAATAGLERVAYDLSLRDTTAAPPERPDVRALAAHAGPLAAAPIWDAFAVTWVLNHAPREEPFYRFADATLGLYRGSRGQAVPVYLAVREVDLGAAREAGADLSWERLHTIPFGHASGSVAVHAGTATDAGGLYFFRTLEPADSVTPRHTPLQLAADQVFFGPAGGDFVVVAAARGEFVGVPAGGLARRVALAWALQSPRLATSRLMGPDVVVLWDRAIDARLARLAPFARFGSPYPVLANGRLYWLATGYVTADAFPLARAVRWRGQEVRYLRAGFLGVVDARSGASSVYLMRDADPVSTAWARLAPEVVHPFAQIPAAIVPHLRFPEDLFRVQLGLLRSGTGTVGSRVVPLRPARVARAAAGDLPVPPRPDAPVWWVGPWGEDSVTRLRVLGSLDGGDSATVSGVVQGTVIAGARRLEVVRFAPPLEPMSPAALVQRLADFGSPAVGVSGARRVVPLPRGVLLLQAAYATGEGPVRLVDVTLQWGAVVGRGRTLAGALANAVTAPAPGASVGAEWVEARRWFERLDQARRQGDWAAFGRAYDELRKLLTGTRRPP